MLTAGSLFSGVGMFDLAFALAGFDIRFQVEIDVFCQKVLRKHAATYWPNAQLKSDVRSEGRNTLPFVDVLFGGFPCTDVSNSGKRAGVRNGSQSGLWREFKRIIGEIQPRIVLLENVAAIVFDGRGIDIVLSELSEMGFDAKWGIISARDVGAPHLRERWWCVGYPKSQRWEECFSTNRRGKEELWDTWSTGQKRISQEGGLHQSRVLRGADGTSTRMDGHRLMSHIFPVGPDILQPDREASRTINQSRNARERIKALGNGGIPQIVYPIALELRRLLEAQS